MNRNNYEQGVRELVPDEIEAVTGATYFVGESYNPHDNEWEEWIYEYFNWCV